MVSESVLLQGTRITPLLSWSIITMRSSQLFDVGSFVTKSMAILCYFWSGIGNSLSKPCYWSLYTALALYLSQLATYCCISLLISAQKKVPCDHGVQAVLPRVAG